MYLYIYIHLYVYTYIYICIYTGASQACSKPQKHQDPTMLNLTDSKKYRVPSQKAISDLGLSYTKPH